MNSELHDQLVQLAENAYRHGDHKLAVTIATVLGCYVHDSLPNLFEAIQQYLGRGAATHLLEHVAKNASPAGGFSSN